MSNLFCVASFIVYKPFWKLSKKFSKRKLFFTRTFLHKNFSPNHDLRSNFVANNKKINSTQVFLSVVSLLFTHTHIYIYIYIYNNLNKLNIKTTSLPSKTIRELVHSSPQRNIFSDAGVYFIPCKDCKLKYISETSRNLHIRLKEHKGDIRIGNSNNALLLHTSQHNHNIDFNSAKMLTYIHNKNLRRISKPQLSHSSVP